MNTALYIARRYLFARKSHNVINVISAISACGMAVGTAALILILSVYNGFDAIIENNLSDLDPDILIKSSTSKRFEPTEELLQSLEENYNFHSLSCVLEEQVLLIYGDKQGLALSKGVDSNFESDNPLDKHVTAGNFSLHFGSVRQVAVGASIAREMGINPSFLEKLVLCYPRPGSGIPLAGLASSLSSVRLVPSCLFSINSQSDASVIVPIESMRELLNEETAISGIELRSNEPISKSLLKKISKELGSEFKVLDRQMQRPAIYKMMKYEKLAIYGILIFVVFIVAFNIFGSLSMLRIEKIEDMAILKAMGANNSLVKKIFIFEGCLISLSGLLAGTVVGVIAALTQQHFGIIKMPSGFMISSYPCILEALDVLLTFLGVAVVGFVISFFSSLSSKY